MAQYNATIIELIKHFKENFESVDFEARPKYPYLVFDWRVICLGNR